MFFFDYDGIIVRDWLVDGIGNLEATIAAFDLFIGHVRKQARKRVLFHLDVAVSFGQRMHGEDLRVIFFLLPSWYWLVEVKEFLDSRSLTRSDM